jgi:hypothetical protein
MFMARQNGTRERMIAMNECLSNSHNRPLICVQLSKYSSEANIHRNWNVVFSLNTSASNERKRNVGDGGN